MPRLLRTASFLLAALYVGLFLASAIVLGVTAFLAISSALEQQTVARIKTETVFLRDEFRAADLERLLILVRSRGHGASALDYLVQGPGGAHLAGTILATAGLRPGWSQMEEAFGDGKQPESVRALVTELEDGLLLAVGDHLGRNAEVHQAVLTTFAWTVGLATMLGICGGILLSRAFLARVDAIARTAEAIIGGDLHRRVPVRGTGDDLDRLAGTLNRMLDRIGALMDSLRQISSDVAHDLRTPLSRLRQRLERALTHAQSTAEYEAAIEASITEV